MIVRHVTLTLALLTSVAVAVLSFSSCGDDTEDKTEEAKADNAPTSVSASFTTNCTTCHAANGIGGTIATESDLVAYVASNSYASFIDLIRENPPTNMTAVSASTYSDAAAKNDYDYFKSL